MNHLQALSDYKRKMNSMTVVQRRRVCKIINDVMRGGIRLTVFDLLAMANKEAAR